MIAVLLDWIYIFIMTVLAGMICLQILKKIGVGIPKISMTGCSLAGVAVITVHTQVFSIAAKIGAVAHLLFWGILLAGIICFRSTFTLWIKELTDKRRRIGIWSVLFYSGLILVVAFFTSRGQFHTDTNIYHAANIRLYEEYGLLKGMANLQLHYGYNSSALAFASFFSMKWLFPVPLHTTSGYFLMLSGVWACGMLSGFMSRKRHLTDGAVLAALVYLLVNVTGAMSPATDYPTMVFCLMLMAEWISVYENRLKSFQSQVWTEEERTVLYGLLSVGAVFAVTMKLSAAGLVILAIAPAMELIRRKKGKEIITLILCGLLCVIPWLVRNILITGWLVYPFGGIDLFQVAWKVPKPYLQHDADQIAVWGKCLFDVSMKDLSVKEWFPIWMDNQERYAKYMMFSAIMGWGLLGLLGVRRLFAGKEKASRKEGTQMVDRSAFIAFLLADLACLAVWFVMAPFIRYGLTFLILIPGLALGMWMEDLRCGRLHGFFSLAGGTLVAFILIGMGPYLDHYITDAGVFAKQTLTEPYYLMQKDYDHVETNTITINGIDFSYPVSGEINSYYEAPGTCYDDMLRRSTLAGDDLKDGFVPLPIAE